MAFNEKPPILSGSEQQQINALRDYLFRLASSLDPVAGTENNGAKQTATALVTRPDGSKVYTTEANATVKEVQKNAQELRSLIIKTANGLSEDISDGDISVRAYADRKTDTYDSRYVAQSTYGVFTENISNTIVSEARGVVESYGYGASIQSIQADIDLIQDYYTTIDGEIRRGIVEDPDTHEYALGIAISQNLQFSSEVCGPSDPKNPGDGHIYYYLNSGQTFGLYTSTGWQFWIDGHKRGYFSSIDGILHVANVQVEQTLQIGSAWQITASADGSRFEIKHVGA